MAVLGFAYLINVQVAFSIWFFYLLGILQVGLLNRFGVSLGTAEPFSTYHPVLSSQGIGALLALMGLAGAFLGLTLPDAQSYFFARLDDGDSVGLRWIELHLDRHGHAEVLKGNRSQKPVVLHNQPLIHHARHQHPGKKFGGIAIRRYRVFV